ncbi:MAG: hemolysin family protein [Candidatus Limnocylindria bacterium]
MDPSDIWPGLLLFALLLVINGFFVAAEYAIVRVRGTQLDELVAEGSARARLARYISDHLDRYISTVQVGVTGASLALGFVGEPAVSAAIAPLFGWAIAISEPAFRLVSFLIAFTLITYTTLVVGELVPKYLAIQLALPLALWTAYPLHLFYRLMRPFVWAVNASATRLVSAMGIRPQADLEAHSEEELKLLVAISTRQGILQESERTLLSNALDFADRLVRQVMVPRTEMVAVRDDTTLEDLREVARQHPFSRLPVYHEDLDHVVGVVHLRDLVGDGSGARTAKDVMRRVIFLPETTHLDQALAEFRRQRSQIAIVVDEFGGTAGLATMEDLLEELVGEVQDEFDRDQAPFREEAPGIYLVDGLVGLDDLRERLGLELEDEPYDTVGGLVFGRLGRLASVGDIVDADGYRFQVTAVDGRRVSQVRAQRVGQRRLGV